MNTDHSKRRPNTQREFFNSMYDTHFERLFYFAKKIVKSEEISQDVLSEVFLCCWRNVDNLQKVTDIRSYLYTSVKNECVRYLRLQIKQNLITIEDKEWDALYSYAIETYTPEKILLQQELRAIIERTVEELPHQCKIVYKLVKEDELKHHEVAAIVNTSTNTVKNHVIKALKRIREAVEEYLSRQENQTKKGGKVIQMNSLNMLLQMGFFC